jgi:hypothetical protein
LAPINSGGANIVNIEVESTNETIEQTILEQTGEVVSFNESNILPNEKMATLSRLKNEVRFL